MEMQSDLKQKIDELAGERRLPTWREMNWDTTTEADAVLFELWRETPAWRKLEMMEGLNQAARRMALIGLRQRFPDATPEELKRRLAVIILGEALATRAYGPISH